MRKLLRFNDLSLLEQRILFNRHISLPYDDEFWETKKEWEFENFAYFELCKIINIEVLKM